MIVEAPGLAVMVIFVVGLLFGMTFGVIINMEQSVSKRELTERGLAIYCPIDGKWAWIGECAQ